jgi:hypothetical protein
MLFYRLANDEIITEETVFKRVKYLLKENVDFNFFGSKYFENFNLPYKNELKIKSLISNYLKLIIQVLLTSRLLLNKGKKKKNYFKLFFILIYLFYNFYYFIFSSASYFSKFDITKTNH